MTLCTLVFLTSQTFGYRPLSTISYLNCASSKVVKEKWLNGSAKIVEVLCGGNKVEEVGYHENGIIGYRGKFVDNQKNGIWIWWDETGRVSRKITILNGQLNGYSITFFPNGVRSSEGYFSKGKETGLWKYWYQNGSIRFKVETENGLEHGKYIEYYETGQIKISGHKLRGSRMNEWILYSENGNVLCKATYDDGNLIQISGQCEQF
jgi:antitoxin component YwqK of YwqJK toxin-antitoxin module